MKIKTGNLFFCC